MRFNTILSTMIAAAVFATATAHAGTIPTGVQNDVGYSTVVDTWGWKEISRTNYGDTTSITDLFAGHNEYVMVAAMRRGSNTIEVLAADKYTTVTTYTQLNQTKVSNGVGWYFNGYSMGFAGATDSIYQNSADVAGIAERDRLSWHTGVDGGYLQDAAQLPTNVFAGWRAGSNYSIYDGSDWERVVFTLQTDLPEPASLGLIGLGLAGLAAARRKSAAKQ